MVEVRLLGIAQDAGVPQAGCNCTLCQGARNDYSLRERAVSLAVIDRKANQYWVIDATPDFKDQFGQLLDAVPECSLGGILLTHLHMGHYTGIIHLGEEAANLHLVPLYCTRQMANFLLRNAPWSGLCKSGNVELREISSAEVLVLSDQLRIHPYEVPHRPAEAETLAFGIQGPKRRLFYCPDIDSWKAWDQDLRGIISEYDIALLDGTFYSADEVPGRDISEIPHPTVLETMDILEGVDREMVFIHLNHTNPLLVSEMVRDAVRTRGFQVGFEGQIWDLNFPVTGPVD
jgi:pyrroloquinoline quinone biosynthesis protein B